MCGVLEWNVVAGAARRRDAYDHHWHAIEFDIISNLSSTTYFELAGHRSPATGYRVSSLCPLSRVLSATLSPLSSAKYKSLPLPIAKFNKALTEINLDYWYSLSSSQKEGLKALNYTFRIQ